MLTRELRPTHKPVRSYYTALRQLRDFGVSREGAVKSAFCSLSASTSLLRIGWGEGGRSPDEGSRESGERVRVKCRSGVYARQHDWTLVPEWEIRRPRQHPLPVDGARHFLCGSSGERARVRCRSRKLARRSINPNVADAAIEEMQALLMGRLFRTIFNNPDFARRNIIVAEIEKVIDAPSSRNCGCALRSCKPLRPVISCTH